MEFTQETIDSLVVNEVAIMKRIAEELAVRTPQVSAVISLVNERCTIPFISRYRKEAHGSLDELQVRECDRLFKSYTNLETRRLEIVRGVFAQGKLTDFLYDAVMNAKTLTELEDLWAPFKKKKKTRGMIAQEKGLEPLADAMMESSDAEIETKAAEFVHEDAENPELSVPTAEDALNGAKDIIAERVSQNTENRADIHDFYLKTGTIRSKGIGDEEAAKTSVYQMYWDYTEALNQIKPHRILAINRGEREAALEVAIDVDVDGAIDLLKRKYSLCNKYLSEAVEDALVRLLSPAVVREIRGDKSDEADEHGISVFSENLKNLLMQHPIKGTRVLGVDPGIRTGTKCAALDETGKYLGYFLIKQTADPSGAAAALRQAIKQYNIQLIAIGNGTGSHEVQEITAQVISAYFPDVMYTVVDESGASVYSASDTAREEFPDLDLTIRGAISMGRRLQDPLAELVKIDPKSIGVGLYQHDVNQKKLSEKLDEVVSSVVNQVGVNLNTASYHLLKYVSGINSTLAKKIVAYRDSNGKIISRDDLKKISGLGPKAFEQCAGFLKIPESADPLDNTWVHPENYAAAREILPFVQSQNAVSSDLKKQIEEKYNIGDTTITDIIDELKKPNRDPRDEYPKPIMQKGVVTFEDLKEGMKVTGKIKNVVDFGAFVDLGIKETALLHISELSDSYVEDPMDVLKVGDIKECVIIALDPDRRRISLSLKSGASADTKRSGTPEHRSSASDTESAVKTDKAKVRRVVRTDAGKTAAAENGTQSARRNSGGGKSVPGKQNRTGTRSYGSDDGLTYNPFAALLKNK
ncbi:MAG: RNA-binding transcriptional accessory protein [Bacteroides sp.]|nr:RNA-binding transcriptional accessory protein [Prevotella sp.]MCM1408032.1 RNA-binding transcriptional accessory protein [Treponema brennaborense]MCM1469008.1 RNA-binding transcriptional accessory protein [Bacteroides sp.]